MYLSKSIEDLVNEFSKLPGVGKKTAFRFTLHFLNSSKDENARFSKALIQLKENIKYITSNALSFMNELKPCSYEFIGDNNDKTRRGFIAQEVLETSIPDLVLGDGEKEGGTYGLDYDGILALAVKAIQELSAQNTSLINRIEALENR
jgi:hypothetical protein